MIDCARSALLEEVPAGAIDAICRKLGVSTCTMRRRLLDEGSRFQKIPS